MTRAEILAVVAALASGYLLGGIPFGYLAAHFRGVDLRRIGSGNIGATNVGRALGRWWGTVVLLLDIAKGLVPVLWLAPFIVALFVADFGELSRAAQTGSEMVELTRVAMGLGTILGHVFTPYLGFRGGKGVATSIGVFAALTSYWITIPLSAYILMRKLTGFVSAGSITLAVLLPLAAWLHSRGQPSVGWCTIGFALAAGALILVRHGANIARLVRGTEHAAPGGDGAGPVAAGEGKTKGT